MKKRIGLFIGGLTLIVLIACNGEGAGQPTKGDDCPRRGDVHANNGKVLKCVQKPGGGLQWQ